MAIGNAEIKIRLELEEAKMHVLVPSVMKHLIVCFYVNLKTELFYKWTFVDTSLWGLDCM